MSKKFSIEDHHKRGIIKKSEVNKPSLDDLVEGIENQEEKEDLTRRFSTYLSESKIEFVLNAVYSRQASPEDQGGIVGFTQQMLFEEALELYAKNYKVVERPEYIKAKEQKRKKRKK
jgi:hypothetical protein